MILVADAGGTKIEWRDISSAASFYTEGFSATNPHFDSAGLVEIADQVAELHFYGAGIVDDSIANKVKPPQGLLQ